MRRARASGLRAALGRLSPRPARAPRVSAVSVQRSSFLLLVAAGVASLPGQGQGEPRLHFIFVFLLTHTILRPNK